MNILIATGLPLIGWALTAVAPNPAPPLNPGWLRIMLPGVCTIDISPKMSANGLLSDPASMAEAIKGASEQGMLINQDKAGILVYELEKEKQNNQIVITQKDLKNYMRIMVQAFLIGDLRGYSASKDPQLTQADMQNMKNDLLQNEFEGSSKAMGQHLLGDMHAEFARLNGYYAIRIFYTRQLNQNAPVKVEHYYFFDKGRLLQLTTSYRIAETALWEADVRHALSTFRIIYN